LASILRGERPMPDVSFGSVQPPRLAILSPELGKAQSQDVSIEVAIEDRGGGIGKVALFHNGSALLAPGPSRRDGKTLYRTFEVKLVEGRNHFKVTATGSDKGSWEESAELVLEYAQSLPKTELYLITAGINRYAEESINLRFAAADAQAIAKVFADRGPKLYGEGKVHVTTLLDDQATRSGIQNALSQVADQARGQDALVLFLAGHGRMVGQRYYFIPHELKRDGGSDTSFEDAIRRYGLARDVLEEWIARVPAQKRVIIYDTCQSGGAIGPVVGSRSGFEFEEDLERMSRALGSYVIAATAASDSAQEIPDLGHGVLTYALLAGLKAVDQGPLARRPISIATGGNVVSVRDWFSFAQDEVPAMTKVYFGQEQFVRYTGAGENFPVLPLTQ
jgi:hypothetical protein